MDYASRFELPGGVALEAQPTDGAVARRLARELERFAVDAASEGRETIRVEPLDPDVLRVQRRWTIAPPLGGALGLYRGRPAVVHWHRDQPEVVLVPGSPTLLAYGSHPKVDRHLYQFVLLALAWTLRRHGALLLHAASCVTTSGRVPLLVGPRGAGKTALLLELLREGGRLLAEDKAVLADRLLHPFQDWVGLRAHHFDALPWLAERATRPVRRDGLVELAAGWLPTGLHDAAARRLDRSERIAIDRLLPGVALAEPTAATDLVLLGPGDDRPLLEPLERPEAVRWAAATQAMMFESAGVTERLAALCDPGAAGVAELLEAGLPALRCWRLALPPDGTPRAAVEALRGGLEA